MSEFKYDYYIEYEDFGGGIELIDIWQPREDLDFLDEYPIDWHLTEILSEADSSIVPVVVSRKSAPMVS